MFLYGLYSFLVVFFLFCLIYGYSKGPYNSYDRTFGQGVIFRALHFSVASSVSSCSSSWRVPSRIAGTAEAVVSLWPPYAAGPCETNEADKPPSF